MDASSDAQVGASLFRVFPSAWRHTVASAAVSTALACGVAGAIVFTGQPAEAESSYESTYGFDRTWNAALRMIRVDMGCKITEKDDQSGYLMFEYHPSDSKKVSSGSMEFIRSRDQDGSVRLVLQLPQMPRYHEQVISTRSSGRCAPSTATPRSRSRGRRPLRRPRPTPAPRTLASNPSSDPSAPGQQRPARQLARLERDPAVEAGRPLTRRWRAPRPGPRSSGSQSGRTRNSSLCAVVIGRQRSRTGPQYPPLRPLL